MRLSTSILALGALLVSSAFDSTWALTNRQLAAQRVVYSYAGAAPPQRLYDLISQGLVGGVLFFGENISGVDINAVINKMRTLNAQGPNPLPLLLMTDQEGGQVRRLAGAQPTLSEKQIGASANVQSAATDAGNGAGLALRQNSMNLNLAPVLGVYRQEGDYLDQYGRSYSKDQNVASVAAAAFIKAQQPYALATAKHFPGLGAATRGYNTDAEPVFLNQSATVIENVDIFPYKAAIAAGVKLIMPSWAVYTAVNNLPSGLSPYWIKTKLRGQLGFQGVTISDAIEAGALRAYGDDSARSLKAFAAGMDIVLAGARNAQQGEMIVNATAKALNAGTLVKADFDAAVARITTLRQGLK